tara:strand:- start:170 stop:358 length:189 start_codon:yes stop_codon:yes gene_type:complete
MIIPKLLINTVATQMVKHFKLDKIMSYVFDKNELDTKVEELEKRIKVLENLKCNYNKEEDNG